MQPRWKKYLLAGTFLLVYTLFTLSILDMLLGRCQPPEQPVKTCVKDRNGNSSLLLEKLLQQQFEKHTSRDHTEIIHEKRLFVKHKKYSDDDYYGPGEDTEYSKLAPEGIQAKKEPKQSLNRYEVDEASVDFLLNPENVPKTVFFVWCGRRWLEFCHYLSILSAIKTLNPDNLIFYFDNIPVLDGAMYNTWFKELIETYPFFSPTKVQESYNACKGLGQPNEEFVLAKLEKLRGIYVSELVVLDHYPLSYLSFDSVVGLYNDSKYAFVQSKQNNPVYELIKNPQTSRYKTFQFTCESHTVYQYSNSSKFPSCVIPPSNLFPKDIWESEEPFARLIRRHFYGSPDVRLPQRNYSTLIPNIAHLVWIGGGEMDFIFYLGVVSLVSVVEVDMVYIHGDLPPSGPYWDRIRHHPKVKLIHREVPTTIYGIKVKVLSHISDIWRVDFMIKYGGIYVDTDVVFVKPLDRDIRAYDAVGSYDWTYWDHPFPDIINFGVALGKKNATFWRDFQKSMSWFVDNDWMWNGLRQPYKIKERHPELVLVEPRLQASCFKLKCHLTWWPGYHDENLHHLNSNGLRFDWRKDVYAFHWTIPAPPELMNEEALVVSNTMFAEVGKYVLHKAGILKLDNRTIVYLDGRELRLNVTTQS